jgi:DNA polymerase III delta prime subunit
MREDFQWADKYRPHKVVDCVLPDRLKKPFQTFVDNKDIPHMILHGTSGVGKTTIALAMCDEIDCDHMLINGSKETGIDVLRTTIQSYASTVSLHDGRKVIIIDEADYMNPNSLQPALRGAIEEFSRNCSFIMTCNHKNRIIEALHSRCPPIDFTLMKSEKPQMASLFFNRITEILDKENVVWSKEAIVAIIMKYFPDFRRTINELQRYSAFGPLDQRILDQVSDVSLKELMEFLKDKDFTKVRKWVSSNSDNDPTRVFRRIYDGIATILKPQSIPQAILIIAKYQYQAAFAADQEINLLACLVELMVESEFL